ncbi:MAG: M15 family metallopeptidase [Betaproteobacteria bacterium]|nr:M15 family metallopeptidase [Betaproteobacteria bacterium]
MINSRDLKELHPHVRSLAERFIAKCADEGVSIIVTSTYRDMESQAALYAQGRSNPGLIVTNAKAGQSFHNYRLAFDFCPIINGKAQWSDTALFIRCGEIAESVGLEWAGRWKSFKELAHCQATDGLTLAQLQAGKTPVFA